MNFEDKQRCQTNWRRHIQAVVWEHHKDVEILCRCGYKFILCINTKIYQLGRNNLFYLTSLPMMNAKFNQERFWPRHENALIKTTLTTFPSSVLEVFLNYGLKLILAHSIPQ